MKKTYNFKSIFSDVKALNKKSSTNSIRYANFILIFSLLFFSFSNPIFSQTVVTTTYSATGVDTWTAPTDVYSVTVEAWGGGGGGGGG